VKARLLVISCMLCSVLAGYYLSRERPPAADEGRKERLFALNPDDIFGIDIITDELISLIRKGQAWWVAGDEDFPADQQEAGSLVRGIVAIPVRGTLNGPGGEFGLDRPAIEVTLHTVKGKHRLFIGSDSPTSAFCYASVQGRSVVFLLPAETKALFRKSLFSLADKSLIRVDPSDVSRIRVQKQGSVLELAREGGQPWRLVGDAGRRLSEERVGDFLRDMGRIKVLSFPEDQSVPEDPGIVVELSSAGGVRQMALWKEGNRAYASSDYQQKKAEISPSLMQDIPSGPDDLLDRSMIDMPGDPVRMDVFSGGLERVFLNRGGRWYEGGKRVRDETAIAGFFSAMNSVEYEDEYLALPRDAGQGLRVRVYAHTPSPPFDITLYSQYYVAAGKGIYRINEGDMTILRESLRRILGESE